MKEDKGIMGKSPILRITTFHSYGDTITAQMHEVFQQGDADKRKIPAKIDREGYMRRAQD